MSIEREGGKDIKRLGKEEMNEENRERWERDRNRSRQYPKQMSGDRDGLGRVIGPIPPQHQVTLLCPDPIPAVSGCLHLGSGSCISLRAEGFVFVPMSRDFASWAEHFGVQVSCLHLLPE